MMIQEYLLNLNIQIFNLRKVLLVEIYKIKNLEKGEISFGLYEESDIFTDDLIPNNFNEQITSEL